MLITPHVLVGLAIGAQFDKPWIVAPLAVGSHFILDAVPHWDLDEDDLDNKDFLIMFGDVVVAAIIAAILTYSHYRWETMWLGGLCAAAPDSHNLVKGFAGLDKMQRFSNVHSKYHSKIDLRFLPGIILQVLVVVICLFLIKL